MNFPSITSRGPVNSPAEDDIEMNAYGSNDVIDLQQALDSGPNDNESVARPIFHSTRFTFVTRYLPNINMLDIERPRFIRGMKESTSACIVFLLLLLIATTWIAAPFGVSTPDLYTTNWAMLRSKTSNWLGLQPRDVTTSYVSAASVSGVYMVLPDEETQERLDNSLHDDPTDIHTPIWKRNYFFSRFSLVPSSPAIAKRHVNEEKQPTHHAYPIHAGRVQKSDQSPRIKYELERCVASILHKLKGQGLEITPGLEFALHDCKAAVDFALEALYPTKLHADSLKLKRSTSVYGVVPGRTHVLVVSSTSDFIVTQSTGKADVKERKSKVGKYVSIGLASLCVFILAVIGCTHHRPSLRSRLPAMPTAQSSPVSVRGKHLDKETISYPVPLPCLAEGIEGAFENPRPAPFPPSWI